MKPGDVLVAVDSRYFRPTEVDALLGDPTKAKEKFGWEPRITFEEMIQEMIERDLEEAAREFICRRNGFPLPPSSEEKM